MKKNIYKFLFVFICMFMIIGSVYAGGTTGTGSGSTAGADTTTATGDLSSSYLPNSGENFVIGIRLSFYTSSGSQIAGTNYVYSTSGFSSGAYTQGSPSAKISGSYNSTWQFTSSFSLVSTLTSKFKKSGYNVDVQSILKSGSLSKENLFSEILNSPDTEKAKKLFRELGVDPDNYYNKEKDSYDLFLVWEPLGRVNYNKNVYIGTAYELSNFVDNLNAEGKEQYCYGANKCTKDGYKGVGKAIVLNMGCAVNLEPDSDFGDLVAKKYPNSFNSDSYFGYSLDVTTASAVMNGCTNISNEYTARDSLKPYAISSNSALGIGILWFDELKRDRITCEFIENYYNTSSDIMCGNPNSYNFVEINNDAIKNGWTMPAGASDGITAEWYKEYCCTPEPPTSSYSCNVDYNVPSCTSGGNVVLEYSDPSGEEAWDNCIFNDSSNYNINVHKWSSSSSDLTYYDQYLSRDYCEVYCVEDVYALFDSENPTVLAGNNFVWGWSTVSTNRTCKTKEIRWEQFKNDLDEANDDVLEQQGLDVLYSRYNSNNWEKGTDEYTADTTKREDVSCTNELSPCSGDGCTDACVYQEIDGVKSGWCIESAGCPPSGYSNCSQKWADDDGDSTQNFIFECDVPVAGEYKCTNYTYTDSVVITGTDGRKKVVTVSESDCVTSESQLTNPLSGGNVDAAIREVERIIEEMKGCYNFEDSNVLSVDTEATISYDSEVYNYKDLMDKSTSYSYSGFGECVAENVLEVTSCSGTSCTLTTENMNKCKYYQKEGSNETIFTLQDDVYTYVLKNPNGLTLSSIHPSDLGNYKSGTITTNWVNVGYSNFPVPYYSSTATYEGALNIEYEKLGHSNSSSAATDVDKILVTVPTASDDAEYGKWSCDYTVDAELVTDAGINLVYREIDLENPFPDTDASTRNTGSNWCDGFDCSWNNDNVSNYILNNRGTSGKKVYGLEPMYTFIMTPSDIIQIRNYNDENTYGDFTGSFGGKNYDFKCVIETGSGCRSDYLTELMNMMDTSQYPGTCKSDRTVYNNVAQFEFCRYNQ